MIPLLVIDMQPSFSASDDKELQNNIAYQISLAKRRGAWIFFVEYSDSGKTHKYLTRLTEGYEKVRRVKKHHDDGSKEIKRAFKRIRVEPQVLKICGVNTDCCVINTAKGLATHFKVLIMLTCCGTGNYRRESYVVDAVKLSNEKRKNQNLVLTP